MIAEFPKFTKLSIEHKSHIEEHTLKYPPYSDFNFTSLISWGDEETYISDLNGNLVIKFKDYITNEPFYTFIGIYKVNQTIKTLLDESLKNSLHPKLRLIPEVTLKTDPKILEDCEIQEDRDNFDYIYLLEETRNFIGKKYKSKRNFVNRFKKLYKSSYKVIDLTSQNIQKEILALFENWKKLRGRGKTEVQNEFLAIKKILSFSKDLKLTCIGIYIENKLVGFSINEILTNGYTMNLFEKADITYMGIFPYLRQITGIYLLELGNKFLNHEQDLGLKGLRKSKMSYNPHSFLKKYTISKKTN